MDGTWVIRVVLLDFSISLCRLFVFNKFLSTVNKRWNFNHCFHYFFYICSIHFTFIFCLLRLARRFWSSICQGAERSRSLVVGDTDIPHCDDWHNTGAGSKKILRSWAKGGQIESFASPSDSCLWLTYILLDEFTICAFRASIYIEHLMQRTEWKKNIFFRR